MRGRSRPPLLRLGDVFDREDLRYLLPHRAARLLLEVARRDHHRPLPDVPLEARDPEFLARLMETVRWLGKHWYRWRCAGAEQLPAAGPALLVGNHNGGLLTLDALLVWLAVWDRHGPDRALYGLGHDVLQWIPPLRRFALRFGALRASHADAERAFAAGHLVLVYPGSDFDSFRPFRERNRIVFGGRSGFVRLALHARVPVVPVVSAGAQEQFVVLTRGEGLARRLDLKRRLRTNVFPLALSVPWGLTSAYLPYVPLPTQVTISFLPPLRWDLLPAGSENDEAVVRRCYDEIGAVMQAELDRLTAGRIPWLGRPADRGAAGP